MGNWFGNLDLAYKYTVVFLSLLALTILAGIIKVLYNRRRLKKFAKSQKNNVESGPNDEQVELNQREKDEGDLFGVRAIEAGFYAGIPQSRPTSRAGSFVGGPSMSANTLIGSLNNLKNNTHSMASSVTSLPLAHTAGNHDSSYLPDSPPRRKGPPTITLGPSEAEMNGRINHSVAVNMSLDVPPSPVMTRHPRSPTFNGSDSDSDNGRHSPVYAPRSNYQQDHYSAVPPQLPMPELLRVSVHSGDGMHKSQAASFNEQSPGHSTPSSPGHPPSMKLPSPPGAANDEHQAHSGYAYAERRSSLSRNEGHGVGATQSHYNEASQPSSHVLLQPQSYHPSHQRDMSNASSIYSENRMSTLGNQRNRSDSESSFSYNYSSAEASNRNSVIQPGHRKSISSSMLDPASASGNSTQGHDPRFSEFYDAYYRQSQLITSSKTDTSKRPGQLNLADQTIVEVPTPLASPAVPMSHHQPGFAM